jgi:hypothetical protein
MITVRKPMLAAVSLLCSDEARTEVSPAVESVPAQITLSMTMMVTGVPVWLTKRLLGLGGPDSVCLEKYFVEA